MKTFKELKAEATRLEERARNFDYSSPGVARPKGDSIILLVATFKLILALIEVVFTLGLMWAVCHFILKYW